MVRNGLVAAGVSILLMLVSTAAGRAQDLISVSGGPRISGTSCPEWRTPTPSTQVSCAPGHYLEGGTYHGIQQIKYLNDPETSFQSNVRHHGALTAIPQADNGVDSTGVDLTVSMKFWLYTYIPAGYAASGHADAVITGEWVIRLHRWCAITSSQGGGAHTDDPRMRATYQPGSRFYGPVTTGGSQAVFRHDQQTAAALTFPAGIYPPGEYRVAVDFTGSFDFDGWILPLGGQTIDASNTTTLDIDAVEVAPPPCGAGGPCPVLMDVTGDGQVTVADVAAWYEAPFDCDDDGIVDDFDLHLLALEAGIALVDCDDNGYFDAVDIFLRPCWDADLDGLIDYCSDPQAPHDPQCEYPSNLHVGPTGADENAATAADPLGTVAFALAVAAAGDTVTVLPGTYTETGIALVDDVVIRGVPGPGKDLANTAIFDAAGGGPVFTGSNLPGGVVLEALTMMNAGAGAVAVESVTLDLVDCRFESNVNPDHGGAVTEQGGRLDVFGCEFVDNTSDGRGGALFATGAYIDVDSCLFAGNEAALSGGAIHLEADGINNLDNTLFRDNTAVAGPGGAVRYRSWAAIDTWYAGCDFLGNTAGSGAGAISSFTEVEEGEYPAYTTVTDCLFAGNVGGTVLDNLQYSTIIEDCTFADNTADYVVSLNGAGSNVQGELNRCLIAFNSGQAIVGSPDGLYDSNIFDNAGGDFVGPIAGWDDGYYAFSADPLFCDRAGGNYGLAAASPCLPANSPLEYPTRCGSEVQGCGTVSAVPVARPPAEHALAAAYPNPFNPSTTIAFSLPRSEPVSLRIYDLAGNLVRTLVAGEPLPAGRHQRRWHGLDEQGRPVGSGMYLYRLQAGGFIETRRMMLLK